MKRRNATPMVVAAAVLMMLAACGDNGAESASDSGATEIEYWLWDANQQPAYQACADAFSAENPEYTVNVVQRGWDDYWSTLTTAFQSGSAPDVFTDHLSRFPEFISNEVLLPLDDVLGEDEIDLGAYAPGLADLWVGPDGKRYGLPKDWDTVALFYNTEMTDEAGITEDEMASLTWNPDDGGTFEEVVARLTVDNNGVRGDEPGFDPDNVDVYGLGLAGAGGAYGQTEWSWFAATTDWQVTDQSPWGNHYNFDDSAFQESIAWWRGLIEKGYMPPLETTVGASINDTFAAGNAAINANGSWMIGTYVGYDGVELGIAPTPVGPNASRASMFNGLADSIYVDTDNPEGAAAWVAFLGSEECQRLVGEAGVVFPAVQSATEIAQEQFSSRGVDVSAFTTHVEDGTTFLFPITDNAANVAAIMDPAMEAVLSGQADVSSLTAVNEEINALLQ